MISLSKTKWLVVAAFAALASCFPALVFASSFPVWSGVVTYVVDGDTVWVRPPDGGKPLSVRMEGIDAPEICQSGGTAARDALKRQILGKRVVVQSRARDQYGRLVARIVLNKQDQGKRLVAQGLAWSYRSQTNPGPYAVQQVHAQTARLGMFAFVKAKAAVYPAEFRKRHGSCYARYR